MSILNFPEVCFDCCKRKDLKISAQPRVSKRSFYYRSARFEKAVLDRVLERTSGTSSTFSVRKGRRISERNEERDEFQLFLDRMIKTPYIKYATKKV